VHLVDRDPPAGAGDVPIQLVEGTDFAAGVEKTKGIGDAVADDNCPIRVSRSGNPDAERARPALVAARFFYPKRLPSGVGDRDDVDVELVAASLGGVLTERYLTVDSVPQAGEANGEFLGDIDRAVGVDGVKRIEVADADRALLRARELREREE
jgi:hypothetical protein